MKKVYQKNPINLTMAQGNPNEGNINMQIAYSLVSKYFHMIPIDEKSNNGHVWLKASVPFITLFTSKEYREKFLAYTINSTDESIIRLRKILSDAKSRKKHYLLMVEKIGDTFKEKEIPTFENTSCAYTIENYLQGGERIRYYLNINGVECTNADVNDLTSLYKSIKEYREKCNQASQESVEVSQKRA